MKLFTASTLKDRQQEELSLKVIRIQEINELEKKANARLTRAEADFAEAVAKSKETWALHIEEQQKINNQLEEEVRALERRKEQALIPVSMYKLQVDKLMSEAQGIVKRAKEKEEQADYLTEKLENKLTDVADREYALAEGEKRLQVAKQGLQSQIESTQKGAQLLSEEILKFHIKQEQDEKSIGERKTEVALAEINFNAKLEKYTRDLEALKIWNLQLKDKEETLLRTSQRLFPHIIE